MLGRYRCTLHSHSQPDLGVVSCVWFRVFCHLISCPWGNCTEADPARGPSLVSACHQVFILLRVWYLLGKEEQEQVLLAGRGLGPASPFLGPSQQISVLSVAWPPDLHLLVSCTSWPHFHDFPG